MPIGKHLTSMRQVVVTCRPEDTLETAATLLSTNRIGAMTVHDKGKMVGILSERDIVTAFAQRRCDIQDLRIGDVMTRNVITCPPTMKMSEARNIMRKKGFRHLPVVEEGEIVGMLSIRDVLEARITEANLEMSVLRDHVIATRHG